MCPPATFWEAAADTATPDELTILACSNCCRSSSRRDDHHECVGAVEDDLLSPWHACRSSTVHSRRRA
jgi:hypothetical protein